MARPIALLLLAMVVIGSLAACGGAPLAQAPAPQPTVAAAAAATAAPDAPAEAPAVEPMMAEGSAGAVAADTAAGAAALPTAAPAAAAPEAPLSPAATAAPDAEAAERRQAPEASLRAGEIDDNLAFADYLRYLEGYQWADVRRADVSERYIISVIDGDQRPLPDALVTLYDGERAIFRGRTYGSGETIFMPRPFGVDRFKELRAVAEYGQARAELTFTRLGAERIELALPEAVRDEALRLDLLFLLDTTSSMGDELWRIQETIDSIVARIDAFTPRPQIRFALVAYRDEGDEYLTRPFDFTTDLASFRQQLGAQSAAGGGDTPEALEDGLYEAIARASWSGEPAVRLTFLVGDAGPAMRGERQFTYLDGTREAVARGIKIYPIAASNSDPQAEYVFRQLAQQTMAGFVFLTYQQGESGGAPGESTTLEAGEQAYTVERLDDLIVGIVERELAAAAGAR